MPCRDWWSGPSAPSPDRGRDRGRDGGYVTAETAVVVPALVLLLGMLLWGLGAVGVQTRCGDAARAAARAAARGEEEADVIRVARAAAPGGAEVRVARDGDLYRVSVEARTLGPGPLAVPVSGEAVAHVEPG
ncbi:TadE family type IV pilus minor pilin [Streptomyces sp. URMC 129]|uniref:TadE family type IV pilus minor pilin n=1 Tax=Streptomyces sp. URMC 129 TaxID=3423407 RepID=UPI003F1D0495